MAPVSLLHADNQEEGSAKSDSENHFYFNKMNDKREVDLPPSSAFRRPPVQQLYSNRTMLELDGRTAEQIWGRSEGQEKAHFLEATMPNAAMTKGVDRMAKERIGGRPLVLVPADPSRGQQHSGPRGRPRSTD